MFLYFLFLTSKVFFDDVRNVAEYSDIDMIISVDLLLKNSDSKDFVDRATKKPLNEIVSEFSTLKQELNLATLINKILSSQHEVAFSRLERATAENIMQSKILGHKRQFANAISILNEFLEENFHEVGYDVQPHVLPDYNEKISLLNHLSHPNLVKIVQRLHETWKTLARKPTDIPNNGTSSLLSLSHPFIIPGGRFREFYYWDTYWILEGLLVSELYQTASHILNNFIHIINTLGYIPNGTRKYYTGRSQPPFFPQMLWKLYDKHEGYLNETILTVGLDMALIEYDFFEKFRSKNITDKNGKTHSLAYFHVTTNFPRPESLAEDLETYEKQNTFNEKMMFSNLKSAAESGWDFSSRWLQNESDLTSIAIFDQIPVDLNAILFRNEQIISVLLAKRGNKELSAKFLEKSKKREIAINEILFNKKEQVWMDYRYESKKFVDNRFYFSNISPLLNNITIPEKNINKFDILKKYQKELFGYAGGVPASGKGPETHQQWDFPNAWAPHQHMLCEYLLSEGEFKMALHVAKAFFTNAYIAFEKNNDFFEKYTVVDLGETGKGGEYVPQTGFGWTNGTLLSFIEKFKEKLIEKNESHQESYKKIQTILKENCKGTVNNAFNVETTNNPLFQKLYYQETSK